MSFYRDLLKDVEASPKLDASSYLVHETHFWYVRPNGTAFRKTHRFMEDTLACRECGKPEFGAEMYMVEDRVWPPPRKGHLHLECLEKVLGRQLTKEDFKQHLPINKIILWAFDRAEKESKT